MFVTRSTLLRSVVLLCLLAGVLLAGAKAETQQQRRDRLVKAHRDGNYKVAYDGFRKLALDPTDDPKQIGADLDLAIRCLHSLRRDEEIDDFREAVIGVHANNWRLLHHAAASFRRHTRSGQIIAGKFRRSSERDDGPFVNSVERDRIRSMQLYLKALELGAKDSDKASLARVHMELAATVFDGGVQDVPWLQELLPDEKDPDGHSLHHFPRAKWRLQYLTDLSTMPDYEEGGEFADGFDLPKGSPVDEQNKPIYYRTPKSLSLAANDGERWRWLLARAAALDPARASEVDWQLAAFFRSQYGVQTISWDWTVIRGDLVPYRAIDAGAAPGEGNAGKFTLHTLEDTETIAQLASGLRRFEVPDEFSWIRIYERIAGRGKSPFGENALDALAREYETRQQYVKAATAWRKAIATYGAGDEKWREKNLDQIVGNWCRIEERAPRPAGKKAVVNFDFRNGKKVTFEAHTIKLDLLLADIKTTIEKTPGSKVYQHFQINLVGEELLHKNEKKYIGERVAAWTETLKPRTEHRDSHLTITTPLEKPGAYLLTARMDHGNTTRALVWLVDTVLLQKRLDDRLLWFVADAISGMPVAGARIDLLSFGWRALPGKPNEGRVVTTLSRHACDANGQLILKNRELPPNEDYLIVARKAKDGLGGADRLAHLGLTYFSFNRPSAPEEDRIRSFAMTDRPVYRPKDVVRFKAWVRRAQYDQPDTSEFANHRYLVLVHNPRNEVVYKKELTTDAFAGLQGEFTLPGDALLGKYSIQVGEIAAGDFRVEEYKKPEFEVTIEAPREPVRLGEKITARIQARYYFDAPVTRARVKYTVRRDNYCNSWFPPGAWDWFYGSGYWWFASNYNWYPGWAQWGCQRPTFAWWGGWNPKPPEIVLENEVPIGPDGMVKVTIDTAAVKELYPDDEQTYTITAAVTDESRRTIDATGQVQVSHRPFRVFAWVDRGYYQAGETIKAGFSAVTLEGKPVTGTGELTLYQIRCDAAGKLFEKAVQTWKLDTDAEGKLHHQVKAAAAGQYRLSYKLTDVMKHTIEGGYVFVVRGEGFADGKDFHFNDLELITDKREYAPGDKVKLLITTNQQSSTVLLFIRPADGVYLPPKVIRIVGKCTVEEIAVVQTDMPNFFVEAVTVHDGRAYTEVREIVVPPGKRVLNVEVLPSLPQYKPGQKATVKVRVTDFFGKPVIGSTVMTAYDRSLEYISEGSNVPEIRNFFWNWRRHHNPATMTSLDYPIGRYLYLGETGMAELSTLHLRDDEPSGLGALGGGALGGLGMLGGGALGALGGALGALGGALGGGALGGLGGAGAFGMAGAAGAQLGGFNFVGAGGGVPRIAPPAPLVQPTIRKNFADTAFWKASLQTDKDGIAEVTFPMPEQLTGWKIKVWAMGHGTRVGQGDVVVTTKKDLLLRMQAPRFFTQKDEVVLSANVHNYLKKDKDVAVSLEVEGGTLQLLGSAVQRTTIAAGGEKRIDWRVKVTSEGEAVVRMKALTDEESDAMQMRFPCNVHGMLKMDSFSGVIRPDKTSGTITLTVPAERRVNQTRLEVRYTPTLAGAMVDALPYMVEYPYGCTEQTLNRFLPTVITLRTLQRMKLDLKDIQQKRTNLNAAELGDDKERAKGWKRFERNAVFDEDEVKRMAAAGVQALANMQCSDGGWGWFSGFGEHSWPHTTATVVHGLQIARDNDVALVPNMLERGVDWLKNYQAEQIRYLQNAPTKTIPYKEYADNLDALVNVVLVDAGVNSADMRDFLYRDRTHLAVYAKALFGLALHKQKEGPKLAMTLENIAQFVVEDKENQTAYLHLPAGTPWWYWYGSETEANAYYLKLLSVTNPADTKAAGLVKYLLNNRKHATYWNSTRDTALCIEAMADYLKASGEDKPDLTIEVFVDGKKEKAVKIDATNLFTFDNKLVLHGDAVETGKHTIEIRKKGTGPVYFNAYLTNFTLEDNITRAGLEVKVNRKYYKLERIKDASVKVSGGRGQAADQKVEKYRRIEMKNLDTLKSGELLEVELEIDSKNDYEYLLFEDPKAAGCEAQLVRSGYNANDLGAYMEMRDDRVCFFVRRLARGKHSVSYRLRAEIPGRFSALPARASAMYAPELKGNSDEMKVVIED